MRVHVKIGEHNLIALLDSGSTSNFINQAVADDIGLHFHNSAGASVIVANGDRVQCQGLARDVATRIGVDFFALEWYAIPLDCFDMVLGIAFIKTLGPILWDFDELCMSFWHRGHKVFWRGIDSPQRALLPADRVPFPRVQRQPLRDRLNFISNNANDTPLLDEMLNSFADVFEPPIGLPPQRPCDHRIHLLPDSQPAAVRPYRYPQMQKDELESQCATMLQQGIIRPSTSPFSAPVLLVKKHDGSWRFCVDYRALNKITVKDKFPIPIVEELIDELHGATFFTKLDLRAGYHQIRVHPNDIEKTAFRTHEGHFEFLVMPFGLTNAPSTFQALMNSVLKPFLRKCVLVFFDDILIYSSSWSEHLQHLRAVLTALRANNLHVKKSKCEFGTKSVAYLGHTIPAHGVAMDQDKVSAVTHWPQPQSARDLRGFLGLAGYYRRFIQDFGTIAAPLTQLLRKDSFHWSDAAAQAFQNLKASLSTAPVLLLPDFCQPFIVDCDASGNGFGAVLHQGAGPLAFFSKSFAARHLKAAAYERELIGLVQAVRHWRPYLWGRQFVIRTDHYALKYMLDQRLSTVPQHQWISKLFGFDFAVEYRPGRLNIVADALSRRDQSDMSIHVLSTPTFQFYHDLREEMEQNAELKTLRDTIAATRGDQWRVQNGLIHHGRLVYIPFTSTALQTALQLAHTTGHEGIQKTLQRLRRDFVIDNDRAVVRDFVHSCATCQRNKTKNLHPAGLLQPLDIPTNIWQDISLDFIEALPKVKHPNCG